jgi:peroxiredoxin
MKRSYLLLICCFLLLDFQLLAQNDSPLSIGSPAPDFDLLNVDGKRYSLKNFDWAEVLAIVFTCNHCPTAQAYEERIKTLTSDYKNRKVAVVAISSNDPLAVRLDELGYSDLNDSYEEMKWRANEHGFNFPYLYDGDDQKAAKTYGAVATPHIFIFDKNRKLRYQGRIDDVEKPSAKPKHTDARNAVDALLAGKAVSVPNTKTFGCSLKWSDKRHSVEDEQKNWAKEPVALAKIDEAGLRELVANKSDKLRLINVWATWCGPCVTEFPDFMVINHMYRNRDFELVTVSADAPEKADKALKFLQQKYASNKNYLFNNEDKYKLIEAIDPKWQGALPYTLLVEPGGKIIYSQQGTIDPKKLRKIIVENGVMGRYY